MLKVKPLGTREVGTLVDDRHCQIEPQGPLGHTSGRSAEGEEAIPETSAMKALKMVLPPVKAPYDRLSFSDLELAALETVLGDGFGAIGVRNAVRGPLPPGIRSGLLSHPFWIAGDNAASVWDDPEALEEEFWHTPDSDDEPPGPAEWFPLHFDLRLCRIYFTRQLKRFAASTLEAEPSLRGWPGRRFRALAETKLYEKPWYEFHALQLLDFVSFSMRQGEDQRGPDSRRFSNAWNTLLLCNWTGQLGRLVEQYSWRFRFEIAAITGVGARKGASAGGRAKAQRHHTELSAWQKAASDVWSRRPDLSKISVAQAVKKRLGVPRTAKHIARVIKRP